MSGSKASKVTRRLPPDLELVEGRPLQYLVKTPHLRSDALTPLLCFLHGIFEWLLSKHR